MEVRQAESTPWRRRSALPILPTPGAAVAILLLFLIQMLATQCGVFAILPSAVSGAIFAVLLLLWRSWFVAVAPLVALCAVLLTAQSGWSAGLSLTGIPLGIGAAIAVYGGMNRLSASLFSGGCCGVVTALSGGVLLFCRGVGVQAAISLLRVGLETALEALCLPRPGGDPLYIFSPEAAQTLCDILISVAPAVTAGLLFLLGCAVTWMVRMILTVLGARGDFFADEWYLCADRGCALIYCGAQLFLLLAMTTPNGQTMYYACYNVTLFFLLPLSLSAFGALIRFLRKSETTGAATKAALFSLGLMLFLAGIYWLFTAAALYGVYLAFCRRENEMR